MVFFHCLDALRFVGLEPPVRINVLLGIVLQQRVGMLGPEPALAPAVYGYQGKLGRKSSSRPRFWQLCAECGVRIIPIPWTRW
jgi:hypothetical protein